MISNDKSKAVDEAIDHLGVTLTVGEYKARDGVSCVEITALAMDGSRVGRVIARVLDTVDVIYLRVNHELYGAGVSRRLLEALERHTGRLIPERRMGPLLEEHGDGRVISKTITADF